MSTPFFELQNISKYFAKVIANKDVSFSIQKGEVLALLGENGAGKSTIMKILYGLYKADEGKIFAEGKEVKIESPKEAMALGISMIQQHFSLVPAHTVTENIILGNTKGKIDKKACEKSILELSKKYGFEVNPSAYIRDLSVGEQQKVEILKALYLDTKLLIMDEPTAVLTPQESENLMQFVKDFTAQGNAVIFITHKLKEVMEVADRIIVMRTGMVYGDLFAKDTNEKELSKLMIGKDIIPVSKDESELSIDENTKVLELSHVTLKKDGEIPLLDDITFDIKKGEIFGIAGVSGNGQQELCEVICGSKKQTEGTIILDGKDITPLSIRERIDYGLGYVPANRHRDGMVMDMSLSENMMLKTSFSKKWIKNGLIDHKKLNDYTNDAIKEFKIKAPDADVPAKSLSGGNQQKVILAREVDTSKQLIIFDQPTRGLDLGAIDHVHKTVISQSKQGKSVLLVSTELSEIFALADRIAVLYKGKIQGIYKASELSTEKIGLLMAGYNDNKEEEAQ